MQSIKASEFKAKCLQLLEVVNETQEEIIITKNGKPISKLAPYKDTSQTLFGLNPDIKMNDDLIRATGESWDLE